MTNVSITEILACFDAQMRRDLSPPSPTWRVERADRVVRWVSPPELPWGCGVQWADLDDDTADGAIAEQVSYFAGLQRRFEWKTYGHDRPADLGVRLRAAGLEAGAEEALVIGAVEDVAAATAGTAPPLGITVRCLDNGEPLDRIAALQSAVWGGDWAWLIAELRQEQRADPGALSVHVAEAGHQIVCAGWVRFHRNTQFASLWGGSTLREWRGRGIYRSLVARRAAQARERGLRYLQVDASPDSRPILERLGLRMASTTTPYVWSPPQP
ncbi:GNAT family N-acetyltransferase [Sorangium sp. So ce1097]|uniref:GNAT family N-acetyltransferase n=1 Tax=Sorangium sp. So ce1097 TaxID=3133330 RepID=UPI003F5F39D9